MIYPGRGIFQHDNGDKYVLQILNVTECYGELPEIKALVIPSFHESNFLRKNLHTVNEDRIKQVIFNDPATIVIWEDGTKTVVKCQPGDVYDKEKGLALCIAKKYFGNKGNFNEIFKKWIPEEKPLPLGLKYEESYTKAIVPEVGTRIKIIQTIAGCLGAEGKDGVVTNRLPTAGLYQSEPGYNVLIGNTVWRINPDAKIETLK